MDEIKLYMKKFLVICTIISLSILFSACSSKVPTCDSSFAENEVIEIYKQNDWLYKEYLNSDPTLKVTLEYPQATSYDKDIDKYFCKATIKIKSDYETFQNVSSAGRYITGIESQVIYDISKSKDKNLIEAKWGSTKFIHGRCTEKNKEYYPDTCSQ